MFKPWKLKGPMLNDVFVSVGGELQFQCVHAKGIRKWNDVDKVGM